MADTVKLDSAKAIPRAWRILMYAVSIMGFGNVAMCSWLPAKLRTATVVYHGLSLLIHIINAIIFMVGFQFTGPFYILIPKLNILFLVICGAALCAANFFATPTQRPNACLYNWAKYNIGEEKSTLQAICVFLVPALTTLFFPNNVLLPWQYDVYLWRWNNRYVIPTFCWLAKYPENNVLEVGLHQRAYKIGSYPIFGFVGHHYDWNLHLCFGFVWRFIGNMYKATRVAVWAAGLATKISMSRKHCEICEWLLGRTRSRPSRTGCIQLDPGYLLYLRRGNSRSRPCASFL